MERRLQRGADIAERLIRLGLAALAVSSELRRTAAARHVGLQLVRAATSAGANYEEARAAESRSDFVHKVGLAAKEPREAGYWFTLLDRSGWMSRSLATERQEAGELAAILHASARTARNPG